MLSLHRRLSALPLLALTMLAALVCSPLLHAASKPSPVKASLVAADASVKPGQPITVALRLVHDAHWHTYWLNPGTGLATSLKWQLPPGWTAGPIQWPAPHLLKDKTGGIIGNGYEGDLLLPVTLTPPANFAGASIDLKATADWLMCEEICVPGKADVALTLPVSPDAPKPDPTFGAKIRATLAALPRPDPTWKVTATTRTDKTVTLLVTPASPTDAKPSDLRFFSDDAFIGHEEPQTAAPDNHGGFILTLPIAADAPKDVKQLLGVLTSASGWLPDNSLRGLRIDTPLPPASTSGPTTATTTPSSPGSTPTTGGSGSGSQPSSLNSQPMAASATSGSSGTSVSQRSSLNSQPAAAAASGSLLGTLLFAFVGGLILNLMPCVFPVLGIKILGFVNQAGHDQKKVVMHGLVFALGVLLSFWSLATVLAILRAGGDKVGWGFQLQSPVFVFSLAAVMLVFAMNMSGVFEFGLSATGVGSELQMKSGLAGSFFTGVLATVVATPCSAPFLAPALGAALAVSTAESFAIFTAIALGLSAPYLLLSIFPQAVKILPRPGAWMETFKQAMAFPLYATVGALVWVLAGQLSDEGLLNSTFGLVLIAFGVWIYGRWNAPGASVGRTRFGIAGLVLAGAAGAWLGWPHTATAKPAPGAPPAVVWETWSPETVAKLRSEGRIVYVDFTARWCATCQANKKLVFHSDDVLQYFADHKVVTLRGDWTNNDPRITAELAAYDRSAVPFNLIWLPGKEKPILLPEALTPGTVLDALKKG